MLFTKFILGLAFCFCLLTFTCEAQVPIAIKRQFKLVVKLIRENKMQQLAQMVEYPLKRQDPLPDITDARAFVAYRDMLFGSAFLKKLQLYNDTDIFEHNGIYGLVGGAFHGDIWMNAKGAITGINTGNKNEDDLLKQITKKIKSEIYPSVNTWKKNIVVCKSAKLTIRIDYTENGLRYVSWSNGRRTTEKPDLILYHGKEEAQGTMGGWTWTFINADWTYIVDDVEMCQEPKYCGYFLRQLYKGVEKNSVRLLRAKY